MVAEYASPPKERKWKLKTLGALAIAGVAAFNISDKAHDQITGILDYVGSIPDDYRDTALETLELTKQIPSSEYNIPQGTLRITRDEKSGHLRVSLLSSTEEKIDFGAGKEWSGIDTNNGDHCSTRIRGAKKEVFTNTSWWKPLRCKELSQDINHAIQTVLSQMNIRYGFDKWLHENEEWFRSTAKNIISGG